jgi:flagellin
MGLTINSNIAAMNAYRNLSVTDSQMQSSLEKLSSGYRINRAADDAAGLAISEGLQSQIGGLQVAVRNAQDGISVVQTAEGALTETHAILQRMNELAVQAANSGSQDVQARTDAQTELNQLTAELDRIANSTQFGQSTLLNGSFGAGAATSAGSLVATGGSVTVTAATNDTFKISAGKFVNAAGTALVDMSGQSAALQTVTVAAGTYSSASAYQTALQTGLDNFATANGLAAGTLQATVTDAGNNVWKVAVSSTKAESALSPATGGTFTIAASPTLQGVTAGASSTLTLGGAVFQVGSQSGQSIGVTIGDMRSSALGVANLDLVNNASAAITAVNTAIASVSTQRATLGAYQNRFEHTINNLNVTVENLTSSESRIRDTDMAQEMVNFTRTQILSQAGTAMLAQANKAPQSILQLLQG